MGNRKSIWDDVQIEPELREYVTLTPRDVADMTMEAMKWHNPAAKLSDMLNERGRAKKKAIDAYYEKRKAEDFEFLADSVRWPGPRCRVKEQPWIKANGRRFGEVDANDFLNERWIVYPDGESIEVFSSLKELVEVWSVD